MAIDSSIIGDLNVELFSTQNSTSESFKIFEKYVHRLGFSGVVYSFVPEILQNSKITLPIVAECTDEYSKTFFKHYIEDPSLSSNDFTIRKIKEDDLSLKDWGFYYRHDQISEAEKQVIDVAKYEHGIKNAISIPTMKEEIAMSGASFFSAESDASFEKLKREKLETLQACTQVFNNIITPRQVMQEQLAEAVYQQLNRVERIVLCHLANDKVMKQIEDDKAKYRYALKVRDNLRKKMGVKTNEKMMYTVGLINLVEHIRRHHPDGNF